MQELRKGGGTLLVAADQFYNYLIQWWNHTHDIYFLSFFPIFLKCLRMPKILYQF